MSSKHHSYSTMMYKQRLLQARNTNQGQNNNKNKRKLSVPNMFSWQNSTNKKMHSRNSSIEVKSKSKSKSKKKQHNSGYVTKFLLQQFDISGNRKNKKVAYIPECIKFKQKTQQLSSIKEKNKKRRQSAIINSNKQNSMLNNNLIVQMLPNRELLKASLKPNKVNFMNRVSNIYDLVLSKVMLPQFIQYFLGEALFAINKSSKYSTANKQDLGYEWKLDQFKDICQKIYENSQQEDLKHFMALSLPTINKWNSRPASTKNTTVGFNTVTTHTDSRVSQNLHAGNRIGYFKSLNRRDRLPLGDQRQSIDILDKLNSKLDNYLKNNYRSNESKKEINQALAQLPLQQPKRTAFSTIFENKIPN